MYEGGAAKLDVGIILHKSGIAATDNAEDGVTTDTVAVTVDAHLVVVTSRRLTVLTFKRQVERPLFVGALIIFIAEVSLYTDCHVGVCHLCERTIAAAEDVEVRVGIVTE